MTQETYTEDLSKFGARERAILGQILSLPLPENFYQQGVKPAMNMASKYAQIWRNESAFAGYVTHN